MYIEDENAISGTDTKLLTTDFYKFFELIQTVYSVFFPKTSHSFAYIKLLSIYPDAL